MTLVSLYMRTAWYKTFSPGSCHNRLPYQSTELRLSCDKSEALGPGRGCRGAGGGEGGGGGTYIIAPILV